MSKSLKRVKSVLIEAGVNLEVIETGTATTALAAAESLGCLVDQIAKSIIFQGSQTGALYLFVTAGAQRVDLDRTAGLAGEPLVKAEPTDIRTITGFSIGAVSPVGHLTPISTFFDAFLMQFPIIYAAAGTPIHVFGCPPAIMQSLCEGLISDFLEKM